MKSDKRQTLTMIGIGLLVLAGVFIAVALSQPKIYTTSQTEIVTAADVQQKTTAAKSKRKQKTKTEKAAKQTTTALSVNYPLNINTATLEELMTIDGLGEKKASAIIEYRNYLGKYTSVEQIMEIEGFGDKIYEQIAGYLTV